MNKWYKSASIQSILVFIHGQGNRLLEPTPIFSISVDHKNDLPQLPLAADLTAVDLDKHASDGCSLRAVYDVFDQLVLQFAEGRQDVLLLLVLFQQTAHGHPDYFEEH